MSQRRSKESGEVWKWFHVTFSTYGAWLPGDPRGYRTRDHREHVEGDYKKPPPAGSGDVRFRRSRGLLKRSAVVLNSHQRSLTGRGLLEMLESAGCAVVAIGVGGEHVHIAVQLTDHEAKLLIGQAKKHAWYLLRAAGHIGRAWAAGCRTEPICDRSHQLNTINYIAKHRKQGAWVWKWGEPRAWVSTIRKKDSV